MLVDDIEFIKKWSYEYHARELRDVFGPEEHEDYKKEVERLVELDIKRHFKNLNHEGKYGK